MDAAALSTQHVRTRLQTLPPSVPDAYDDVLDRIESQEPGEREIALKALAWICHAYRALSLQELQHALSIEPHDAHLDEERLVDGGKIIALCHGLVLVSQTGVVGFAHGTARSYFESHRHDLFPMYHTRIAFSCAAYLNELKDASIQEFFERHHLAKYAACHMEDHADPTETQEGSLSEVICEFLSRSGARKDLLSLLDGLGVVGCGHCSSPDIDVSSPAQTEVTPVKNCSEHPIGLLQLAASMGLARVVSILLNETISIETLNKHTFDSAVERGFARAIEFLVGSSGHVDLRDDHGVQVLLAITARDWNNAAEIITQKAKLAASGDASEVTRDRVQLLLAAYYGDDSDADRLVKRGNIDFKGEGRSIGATALFLAVERNHPQTVQILLSAGVDVDSTDSTGQTALHRATRRGREVLVRQLLWNGADVDIQDDEGKTAWSRNAPALNEKILGFLLDAGADPNTIGPEGVSLLYSAACSGNEELVRYLIKSGANPSIKTKYKWAPLHWAAASGYFGCVKLLAGAGAQLSPLSDQLVTPLDLAIRAGNTEIADFLIEKGAQRALDVPDEEAMPVKLEHIRDVVTINVGSTAKAALTFDKPLGIHLPFGQFIYYVDGKGHSYYVSHPLDTDSDLISIGRGEGRPDSSEYPLPLSFFNAKDTLYEIRSTQADFSELEIRRNGGSGGSEPAPFPSVLTMRMSHAGNWEILDAADESLVLRATTPDWSRAEDTQGWRWLDGQGKLVARMGGGWAPQLTLERGLDAQLQDVLVASYVAKIRSDTVIMQRWYGASPRPCDCNCNRQH